MLGRAFARDFKIQGVSGGFVHTFRYDREQLCEHEIDMIFF